jgi:hypothetical protein
MLPATVESVFQQSCTVLVVRPEVRSMSRGCTG